MLVRAHPGARRNAITGVHAGALKISVTQAAEKGKANAAIAALLAKRLGLAKSRIEVLSGHTSSQKRFLVRGASSTSIARKLDEQVGSTR